MTLLDRMNQVARAHTFDEAMRANRKPSDLMMLPVDWRADRMPARAMVELKHDGIHIGYRRGAAAPAFTREGGPFMAVSHLRGALDAIEGELQRRTGKLHRLFGEYENMEGFEATIGDFHRGEGDGVVTLFDAVSDDAWRGRCRSLPLIERRALLREAIAAAGVCMVDDGVGLVRSSLYQGDDRDNIEVAAGEVWAQNKEGLVVKCADSPYVRGPSPYWMRLKRSMTVDLPVADVDVRGGRVVAFMVEPRPGVVARIGRGLSDALRAAPGLFRRGRVVEVKHLGETRTGNLRSASFLRFRDDKGE